MVDLAADFDTWGIPSRTFLILYLLGSVVLVTGVLIHRRMVLSGRSAPPADQLNPQQVAYLNGGAKLALWSSIGSLRGQGTIGVHTDGALTAEAPPPTGATPLDRAVHHAASQRYPARQLRYAEWVARALVELRDGLIRHDLLTGPERRARLRLGPLLLAALLVLGVTRIVAGLANDRPVLFLVLTVVGLAAVTVVLFVWVPRRTRAADRVLRTLRQRNHHLAPSRNPAYTVYGATGLAMAVALYGTASLWAVDPTFAAQAEIQRQAMAGGGATSSCGGGSTAGAGGGCGGGDGGGGGGCGGGCGG
ncbi:TIGR04222 domain-containing membrane protein [Micromonospora radicis]|uniref:TIGR04222 domain-containing membrane protein n=1 Tax=Micromonospora radicis TaxID=1894971 RepID=A0A418MRT9_9ACTN|nr:TIGR04222 domain-containing membrane protein [Micromonospora radicis]RIV36863.1 TIGR04222 domain-containing membrane protein [Micromonospora radicis]